MKHAVCDNRTLIECTPDGFLLSGRVWSKTFATQSAALAFARAKGITIHEITGS